MAAIPAALRPSPNGSRADRADAVRAPDRHRRRARPDRRRPQRPRRPARHARRDGPARRQDDVARIAALADEFDALEIVVGLPLSLSGGDTPSTTDARDVRSRTRRSTVPVRLVDERLSTVTAQRGLRAAGRTAKKSRSVIDQVAAVIILQHALDLERSCGAPPGATLPDGSLPSSPKWRSPAEPPPRDEDRGRRPGLGRDLRPRQRRRSTGTQPVDGRQTTTTTPRPREAPPVARSPGERPCPGGPAREQRRSRTPGPGSHSSRPAPTQQTRAAATPTPRTPTCVPSGRRPRRACGGPLRRSDPTALSPTPRRDPGPPAPRPADRATRSRSRRRRGAAGGGGGDGRDGGGGASRPPREPHRRSRGALVLGIVLWPSSSPPASAPTRSPHRRCSRYRRCSATGDRTTTPASGTAPR